MADTRKKGCPNEGCKHHEKKIKMKAEYRYCPLCGAELVYVCAKCFDEIEDLGPKHKICKRCEIEAKDKRDQVVDKVKGGAKKAGGAVAAAGGAVVMGIGAKVLKDAKSEAIKKGVKVIEETAKAVIKAKR